MLHFRQQQLPSTLNDAGEYCIGGKSAELWQMFEKN